MDPVLIGLIIAAVVIVVGLMVLLRRRRNAAAGSDVPVIPEVSDQVDYTSIPYQEKLTPMERFQRASPAVKALAVLAPLAAIGLLIAVGLTLTTPTPIAEQVIPPPLAILSIARAEVVGNGKIVVEGMTENLPAGTGVSALMREGEDDFAWFNADIATAAPDSATGRVAVTLERRSDAPVPVPDRPYSVVLIATPPSGQPVRSEPAPVVVLGPFAGDFFQNAAVVLPTIAPTVGAIDPAPAPTAAPELPPTGAVRADGNVRAQPNTDATILGNVTTEEQLELLARSADGEWYRAVTQVGEGWVSATLLEVDPAVAEALPREEVAVSTPTATGLTAQVFNGGNLRDQPNLQGAVLDQVNADENVDLISRNASGTWLRITNVRGISGWVSTTLLTLGSGVLDQVPVDGAAAPAPPAAPAATGLTAQVFNGGNVRTQPTLQSDVLDQIIAGETVTLLGRNADGEWYRITNTRGVSGWVNRTLLTVDPGVAARVPVV